MNLMRECRCPRVRHRHGTHRAYNADRCRCLRCRAAHANATTAYRHGQNWREALTDATGTRRRLQALAAAGVTTRQVADHTGLTRDMAAYLRRTCRRTITHRHARLIADAYDALWDKAKGDADSRRCATQARTYGWLPPLAWDDDEIDQPDARPHNPTGGGWEHKPCGTPAAARRHNRRGEPLCEACAAAAQRQARDRRAAA